MRSVLLVLAPLLFLPLPGEAQLTERLYQEACDDGDLSACTVFGLMSELGQGVTQDLTRSRALYRRACEGGELVGCTNLGLMCEEGVGGEQDMDEARGQFRIACEGDEQLACDLLAALADVDAEGSDERRYFKRGRVADATTTTALSGALVEVPALDIRAVTDAQGLVSLGRLPEGLCQVRAERLGYATLVSELQVPGGTQFMIMLERDEAEDTDAPGRIEGQVTDGGNGEITDVDISVIGQERVRALSNQRGRFALTNVEPGLVQVRFTRLGYTPRTATLVVQPGRTSEITAAMAAEAIELAAIEVTVRSAFLERSGFYDRARQGQGRQLSRRELDRIDPFDISDVIRRLPGVRLQDSQMPGQPSVAVNPRVRTQASGRCDLEVYIDGARTFSTDLNQIPPDWLDAMEVYLGSEAPVQYSGLNPCGVVLLWTRR
jgi:hypothetical protein